jgi:A/G-specific adenine glycosylase
LLAWYRRHARDLPWRRTGDPYAVWLSEIMLQQTQVATVGPYFERFLAAFPTIEALAAADEQRVLRLWEGLGYYRRARQLHRAAEVIVREHGGRFPEEPEAVRRLPGIGRYTAGAILSIAFGQRQPILEANTTRLLARLLAYRGQPTSAEGQRLLWAAAEAVLPRKDVGHFNQAMMELGSEVCTARSPRCEQCPVVTLCGAHSQGLQHEIPQPKPKPAYEDVREAVVVVRRRGRVLLVRCGDGGRWAGLWDFPRLRVQSTRPADVERELVEGVRRLCGLTIRPGQRLATIRHGVTRYRITLDCYEAKYEAAAGVSAEAAQMKWLRPAELEAYPLSTTGRKLAKRIAGE